VPITCAREAVRREVRRPRKTRVSREYETKSGQTEQFEHWTTTREPRHT